MSNDIQSALERARMVAAKITGQIPEANSAKRPADSSNDGSAKKFASINDAVGAQLAMLKAQQLGGNASEEYKVPDKLVGLVIGRGGEQLHRLQADTQCKVQIAPDSNGSSERTFTLVGSKEAIERAKRSIDEILKRGSSLGSDPSATGTSVVLQRNNCEIIEIKIPGNKCGLVIGKGGETIKRLSEQYGVKLVVVQETSAASSGDKPLRITGEPEKVAKAKEAVLEMLNPNNGPGGGGGGGGGGASRYQTNDYGSKSHYGGGSANGSNEVFIKVPGDKAGIVIGKGGESIKEINRRSGAHVEIDKSQRGANATEGADKMFIIRGTSEQIQYAQQLIYEKITGVQGSQPPSGFFGPGSDMSPLQSYGGAGRNDTSSNYQQQQWNMAYQQSWQQPQVDPKTGQADPNMSAAWAAYYQQYYGQAAQPAAATTANGTATSAAATVASAATAASPSINPQTGQPDYSQAWVEYYRSLGMHEQAEAIIRQTAQSQTGQTNGSSSTSSSSTPSTQSSASATSQQPSTTPSTQQNGTAQQQQYAANQAWAGYSGYGGYGN